MEGTASLGKTCSSEGAGIPRDTGRLPSAISDVPLEYVLLASSAGGVDDRPDVGGTFGGEGRWSSCIACGCAKLGGSTDWDCELLGFDPRCGTFSA